MNRIEDMENRDRLFDAILSLENREECAAFFGDLCTKKEIKDMAQRLLVAKLLREKRVYSDIVKLTGASTATISRVNRSLDEDGNGGYSTVFERIEND